VSRFFAFWDATCIDANFAIRATKIRAIGGLSKPPTTLHGAIGNFLTAILHNALIYEA
jgi:hypothetical protein